MGGRIPKIVVSDNAAVPDGSVMTINNQTGRWMGGHFTILDLPEEGVTAKGDFVQRLTSRKFLLAVASFLTTLGLFLSGQLDAVGTITAIGGVVATYNLAQGHVDAMAVSSAPTA